MSGRTRIVTVATIAHAVVGTLVAVGRRGPILAIDDLAFLSMGRTLAGGGSAPLGPQPPYGVLYPALLAPGWLVGLGESQMVVYGQVLNAVLGALLVPVLYLLVRRLTDASVGWSLGAALLGASLPAGWLTASIVWTERLLPLLVALGLLAALRFLDDATERRAAAVLGVAVALFAAHPRMIAVAVVLAAVPVVHLVRARRSETAALVGIAAVGGLFAVDRIRAAVATATFGSDATYGGGALASTRGLDDLGEMTVHAVGTLAYAVLATGGLAVLGVVALWRASRRAAVIQFAMTAAMVAVAGWFLTGVDRADAWLHGRYIEVLLPLFVAFGLLGARRIATTRTAAAITVGVVSAGVVAAWAGPGDVWTRARSPVMMLGVEVSGAPFGARVFEPGAAASMALLAGLVTVVLARHGRVLLPPVLAVVLVVAVWSGTEQLDSLQRSSFVGQVQAALPADEPWGTVVIESDRIGAALGAAVAWEVGLDHATTTPDPAMTHLVIPVDAEAPPGAVRLVDIGELASVWRLARP